MAKKSDELGEALVEEAVEEQGVELRAAEGVGKAVDAQKSGILVQRDAFDAGDALRTHGPQKSRLGFLKLGWVGVRHDVHEWTIVEAGDFVGGLSDPRETAVSEPMHHI